MGKGRTLARVPVLVGATLVSAYCTDAAAPDRQVTHPLAATAAAGDPIQLDQWNGTMGGQLDPLVIIKGFNPTNPHVGDAIIATFFWFGTPSGVTGNIIDSVTDHLTQPGFPRVGNKYNLVEFVTNGNVSMATYLATNVQNFPDAGTDPTEILAVRANLHVPVVDGGVLLSAWIGVASVATQALGEHRSASGLGTPASITGPTTADPGAISVNAGALAYGVSMASPPASVGGPPDWTSIAALSDLFISSDGRFDARFTVSSTGGTTDPQWLWFFSATGVWLATDLALNAAPTTGDLIVTTSTSGENVPTNDYTVTLDGTTSQPIPPNGAVTFTGLQPGNHEVALSGLPTNCELTSANPVTVTIVAGETATTTFTVSCSAPPPPPPPPPPANDFMTGGGKLGSGREFATFGLEARPTGGNFEWVQHCPDRNSTSALCARGKFAFHGTVTSGTYADASRGPNCRTWSGTGTSKELGASTFTVQQACDGGQPGRGLDYIEVTIDSYHNAGYLSGGNIQLHRSTS
ncbi:MAG TPA: post-COAP-1 domain-containing protein [Gemmatimonadales bacterium]|jgi:hypothetical protein